jgi:uncharacterized RDD family membrane protein YckC
MENSQQNTGFTDYNDNTANPYGAKDYRVGFGRRLGAALLDMVFLSILMLVGIFSMDIDFNQFVGMDFMEMMENQDMLNEMVIGITTVSVIISLLYYAFEIFMAASFGKLILGIKIADSDMKSGSFQQLFIRYIIKHISSVFSAIYVLTTLSIFNTIGSFLSFIILIGFFFVLGENKQAFHDMIAGTAVYYKQDLNAINTGQVNG